MGVAFQAEGVKKPKLRYRIISGWLKQMVLKFNCVNGNLTYIFCDDEYLKKINNQYLNHDYYTDIVTFDYCENKVVSGDMFISLDRVKENAVFFECKLDDELLRVMVHGLLHLLGLKDSSQIESAAMRKAENEAIILYKEIEHECIK